MDRPPALTSLPENLEMGLLLLERGHALAGGGREARGVLPNKVIALFNRLERDGIDWLLVGAEAVNLYIKRPRATVDVDIVVRRKHLAKVKKILTDTCDEVRETEVHYKGVLSAEPLRLELDVIKSQSQSHELFEHQVSLGGVRVPRVEALLALKYLSAVSPWRRVEDKRQDVVDFGRTYKDNRPTVDRDLLIDLASRAHQGAREDFATFLDAIENDRPIQL